MIKFLQNKEIYFHVPNFAILHFFQNTLHTSSKFANVDFKLSPTKFWSLMTLFQNAAIREALSAMEAKADLAQSTIFI